VGQRVKKKGKNKKIKKKKTKLRWYVALGNKRKNNSLKSQRIRLFKECKG
jgi:hypothetical protein